MDWRRSKVLVTGGTGMIGANLVLRLVALGNRPTLFARDPARGQRLGQVKDQVDWLRGDIADADSVARAVAVTRPTLVFHLAGSFFNPPTLSLATHMAVNAMGMLNLCEALKRFEGLRLVIAGSCSVYAGGTQLREDAAIDPSSIFGVSKAAGAMIARGFLRLHGIETIELRLFTPFGPWENARRLIPSTILSALAGEIVRIGHGGQQRDFVYMDDVVDAFLRAAEVEAPPPGLVVNIGTGAGRSIRDVVARVLELMGNPVGFCSSARPTRPDEIWEMSADISAAARHLDWRPKVDFDEGLRRTIGWFSDNRTFVGVLN